MNRKTSKLAVAKRAAARAEPTVALAVEDDERHSRDVDDFVAHNCEPLNASIRRSRKEVTEGKFSKKSINDIIAEGRRRHIRNS